MENHKGSRLETCERHKCTDQEHSGDNKDVLTWKRPDNREVDGKTIDGPESRLWQLQTNRIIKRDEIIDTGP